MKTKTKGLIVMCGVNYAILEFTNFPKPDTTGFNYFLVFIIFIFVAMCTKGILVAMKGEEKLKAEIPSNKETK